MGLGQAGVGGLRRLGVAGVEVGLGWVGYEPARVGRDQGGWG